MRTRVRHTKEQRMAAARHLAAKREAYQRQVEEVRKRNATLPTSTIAEWTTEQWAEFERRIGIRRRDAR